MTLVPLKDNAIPLKNKVPYDQLQPYITSELHSSYNRTNQGNDNNSNPKTNCDNDDNNKTNLDSDNYKTNKDSGDNHKTNQDSDDSNLSDQGNVGNNSSCSNLSDITTHNINLNSNKVNCNNNVPRLGSIQTSLNTPQSELSLLKIITGDTPDWGAFRVRPVLILPSLSYLLKYIQK